MTDEIPPQLLDVLRDIGLDNPDVTVPLHAKLVGTLHRLGPGASFGSRLVALRFDFVWELEEAGRVFAKSKTDYEHQVDKSAFELLATIEKMSVAKAELMARASDKAYVLLLESRLAEQRERAVRNFLQTIQSAQDNERTRQANERAADLHHARSAT